jgi:pimeloyl-ACP methyl ester carboxylesterase
VLEHGMPRFFRRLAEGVFDHEDLVNRTHELADFAEQAVNEYGLDSARFYAVGFSNGANIAASLLLLHPGLLAGAVLLRAMVPFELETMPDLSGTPVYLAAGRSDRFFWLWSFLGEGGAGGRKIRAVLAQLAFGRRRRCLGVRSRWTWAKPAGHPPPIGGASACDGPAKRAVGARAHPPPSPRWEHSASPPASGPPGPRWFVILGADSPP